MKNLEVPISIRAYAKGLFIDEKAVRQAIKDGKIKKGIDKKTGKILPSKADVEWGNVHKTPKPQRGVSSIRAAAKIEAQKPNLLPEKKGINEKKQPEKPVEVEAKTFNYQELISGISITSDLPYSEALRRKEILNIAKERMNLEVQNGTLVYRADVDKALFNMGDTLKRSFLNIPARCVADIRAAATEVEAINILTNELQSVLYDVSDLKYKPNVTK